MKNNFWEEQSMTDKSVKNSLKEFHGKEAEEMELPEFAKINCPECEHKIHSSGIRQIALCFNSRNIGDVTVEYHCDECLTGNTVYFRKEAEFGIEDFCALLKNEREVTEKPVAEESMYKLMYNNLMEKFIQVQKNEHD